MKQTGVLLGIAIKNKSKSPMDLLNKAIVSSKTGIASDYRGKSSKRQVTVLSAECWDQTCKTLNTQLHWKNRRANLLISGIDLKNSKGRILQINDVSLKITGETTPCKRMDELFPGLKNALVPNWHGGVTCKVIK